MNNELLRFIIELCTTIMIVADKIDFVILKMISISS